ncbi:MAG: TVP38/TMEM64 family protein [Planctomycetota bacterium]
MSTDQKDVNESAQGNQETHPESADSHLLPGWACIVVGLLVVVSGLMILRKWIPIPAYFETLLKWTESAGFVGAVVLGVVYIIGSLLLFPGSVLTMGAGFLYGLLKGTILVSLASTATACIAFIIGRTVGRGWVADKIKGNKKFSAVDDAVGQEGFKIVFLVRLSPLFPFTLQNYAFGLTDISFWKYALASWIGMLPGTFMYIYFGDAANTIVEIIAGEATMSTPQKISFWVGLFVTIGVVIFVTRLAKDAITKAMEESNADGEILGEND